MVKCNKIIANIDIDSIESMMQHFIVMHKEPLFFIFELPASVDDETALGKAVVYAKNQKHYMENYLLDGRCSISNNAAENAIRPFTVGWENWLFAVIGELSVGEYCPPHV